MGELTHNLKRDHRVIEKALRALDGVCTRLERGEAVPLEPIVDIHNFITAFGERLHHDKEELYLLPAMLKEGVLTGPGVVLALMAEHEKERRLLSALGSTIEAYRAGAPVSCEALVLAARQYIVLVSDHFRKEENVLFRIVEESLEESTRASIWASLKQADSDFGSDTRQRYEQMAEELEDSWG